MLKRKFRGGVRLRVEFIPGLNLFLGGIHSRVEFNPGGIHSRVDFNSGGIHSRVEFNPVLNSIQWNSI